MRIDDFDPAHPNPSTVDQVFMRVGGAGRVQENNGMKQLTLSTYKSLIYKVLWTMGQGGQGKNVNSDSHSRYLGQSGVRRMAKQGQ